MNNQSLENRGDSLLQQESDIYIFLEQIVSGQTVNTPPAGEGITPTLEQRLRAALKLLEKIETMHKKKDAAHAAKENSTIAALNHGTVEEIKQTLQRKLASIAEQKKQSRVSKRSQR